MTLTTRPPYKDPILLLLAGVLVLAFALPSLLKREDEVSKAERYCAWRGAERFVYNLDFYSLMILDYEVRRPDPQTDVYLVLPYSYFGAPLASVSVRCVPNPNGTFSPLGAWKTVPFLLQ